jgi:tRNA(fMet)-specific endonuclease VapC
MLYLIDTCVFAEYTKLRENKTVTGWVDAQPQESVFISVLTIGEIEKGIVRMPASRRQAQLAEFLENLFARFDDHVLDLTVPIFRRWAQTMAALEKQGRPLPVADSLIAATALEHNLTLVTRNESDFTPTGVKILNLWQ